MVLVVFGGFCARSDAVVQKSYLGWVHITSNAYQLTSRPLSFSTHICLSPCARTAGVASYKFLFTLNHYFCLRVFYLCNVYHNWYI